MSINGPGRTFDRSKGAFCGSLGAAFGVLESLSVSSRQNRFTGVRAGEILCRRNARRGYARHAHRFAALPARCGSRAHCARWLFPAGSDNHILERRHRDAHWAAAATRPGQYNATLSDAAGEAFAEASGNLFHLRYLLRRPAVYIEQWLYLQPDGHTVLNFATVTAIGIPVARLSEEIKKIDSWQDSLSINSLAN